ncbi:unnamed protein product [Closterium sp. NIES-53]
MSADKLSARAIPCVFLGFTPDAPGWQFYHPTSCRVFPSQDVTFDEPVPFYHLFPYRSPPPWPPPLFLAPDPTPVDPLPPQGPAPSGVSQVDPLPGTAPVKVAVGSGAVSGDAASEVAAFGGAEPGVAESEGAGFGGAEPRGEEPRGAGSAGVELGGAETEGAGGTGAGGASAGGTTTEALEFEALAQKEMELLTLEALWAATCMSRSSLASSFCPQHARYGTSSFLCSTRVPLLPPPESTHPAIPDPESDHARAASPIVSRLMATAVIDPSFESAVASALVAELLDFAASCRLDYATALVAEAESASPPSIGGECAPCTDIFEDRQEDFQCLAANVPRFASMLLALEGDLDAPDIPTLRSYAEAITGPYSSQWQAAMDVEMASWQSTGTYVDEVPPPRANIVNGMWIFRVKRPPGSPPAFKARYVARGFSYRQGVDYIQTFSPTPKMTTLQVLLHVDAQRDYELHSLDFNTAFLQGSLHEEIWLRRPPGFTGSFPAGTQWSLRRPVYSLCQAPHEWHDTLRTTLAALGFAPSTADPSLFLRTDTSLQPFYVLLYVDDLVFATADIEALTLITWDRARRTITLTHSHMVHQVFQRFGFQFSSPQPTSLSSGHSLSAPPLHESIELSGPYPELVGCLMYLMTCTRPDLAYPLNLLARYVAPVRLAWGSCLEDGVRLSSLVTQTLLGSSCEVEIFAGAMAAQELRWLTYLMSDLGEQPRSPPVLYVDNKAMIALCQEYRLEHRTKHIALRYFLARELQQRGQLHLSYVATRANTADIFTKAGDHQRVSTVLGLVPTLPPLLTA